MKLIISILALVALAHCSPVAQETESVAQPSGLGSFANCMNGDVVQCLKEKALLMSERFESQRQLNLAQGIAIINNAPEKEGRSYEPLSTDVDIRKKQVSERLSEKMSHLLENTELEISFGAGSDEEQGRDIGEGRKKKKKEIKEKLKILLPLLLILKVKALILITISIVVIAAALFKLAVLAKLAFIAKVIILIKQLLAKHKEQEEAWVPHHDEHHGHGWDNNHGWEGGWSRSRNEANNLAYSAYNN